MHRASSNRLIPVIVSAACLWSLSACGPAGETPTPSPTPVSLPVISVDPTSIDFGAISLGTSEVRDVTIYNEGLASLTVSAFRVTGSSNPYRVEGEPGAVEPGASLTVTITYKPTAINVDAAAFVIESNASNNPNLEVSLTGQGLSPDNDSDGFTVAEGDCNDKDSSINPGETETCNGEDNNCEDGEDDAKDLKTWYKDSDDDTYGIDNRDKQKSCEMPGRSGWSLVAGDCDDTNAAINPDAEEICDQVDNNCNGQKDEGFDSPTDQDSLADCQDYDRDGERGDEGDCNDSDASVNTKAPEVALNNKDDDCDGLIDEDTPPSVRIDSPLDAAVIAPGYVTIQAYVNDQQGGDETLRVTFSVTSSTITPLLPMEDVCTDVIPEGGVVLCNTSLAYGFNTIVVTATDGGGLQSSDDIMVLGNTPPTAEILSPAENSEIPYATSYVFEVAIADVEDGDTLTGAQISLSSDRMGPIVPDSVTPVAGQPGLWSISATLRGTGTHVVTAVVTDSLSTLSYPDTVTVSVLGPDCGGDNVRALFRFDEGSGTDSLDLIHGLSASLVTATWSASSVNSSFKSSLSFDGDGQFVEVQDGDDYLSLPRFTVDFWFKGAGVGSQTLGRQTFIYKNGDPGNSDKPNYSIALSNSGLLEVKVAVGNLGSVSVTASDTTALKANTWYHIATTFDGTTLAVFLNGQKVGTGTAAQAGSTPRMDIGPLYIGTNPDSSSPTGAPALTGFVDELQLMDCALPDEYVVQYYQTKAPHVDPLQ